jgi:hypothetical protein
LTAVNCVASVATAGATGGWPPLTTSSTWPRRPRWPRGPTKSVGRLGQHKSSNIPAMRAAVPLSAVESGRLGADGWKSDCQRTKIYIRIHIRSDGQFQHKAVWNLAARVGLRSGAGPRFEEPGAGGCAECCIRRGRGRSWLRRANSPLPLDRLGAAQRHCGAVLFFCCACRHASESSRAPETWLSGKSRVRFSGSLCGE